jgi:BlaI family transcriptional regulator, penicillinase repressor
MTRKAADVTETELAILDVLWERGPIAIREIVAAVYRSHTPSLHATVKSLLERLQEKGYIACDTSGFAHRFSASITREEHVGAQLQQLAASHFNGAMAPMLMSLVERIKLSRKDREAIRKIIEGIQ